MRIAKVSLQNFRAFDEPFELDLDGGKNLLLHGENGSGTSGLPCRKWSESRVRIGPRLKGEFDAASEVYARADHREVA